ncbi:PAN2 family 3 5 exonuclease [Cryptosporidium sp. chipmunk genotype I]|uniref:PAN2 family 3 5 exonuclease n=1 Tax=Cryptosporidium sp. chipmunk genotype I TaxID=1280935 RepID=UPI00351A1EBC|nr:PAN2 family 3 5 exonuclease [Cryptosporidium sp. chipmunk genotype I]
MQNRLLYSEGDYEDSFLSGVVGLDTGSNGSGNSTRRANQGGGAGGTETGGIGLYEGRMSSKGNTYYSSEINHGLAGINGGRSSVGYYDHFGGVGSGHLDSGIGALGGELRVGQASWGWETYTSYNMIGLFSSHTNNRKIRPFISSIYCDPFYELLWLGWTNGFLSSFRFPHCSRYTAFPVGIADSVSGGGLVRDNVIYMGFPSSSHLFTVTNSGIGVYSRGGAPISSHSYNMLTNDKQQSSKILCCDSNRYQSYMMSSHPIIGIGTGKGVSILDLQQLRPIHSIPYSGSISCIKSSASSSSFIVGGVNMLGIADTRLPRLGHTIQIHPTNSGQSETLVSGLAVNEYTVAIITSTISNRKILSDELLSSVGGVCGLPVLDLIRIHPGEVSTSPEMMVYKKNLDLTNMMRDSIVRLYDTRKFRPRKNVSFSPGPINIAWSDNSLAISAGAAGTPDFEDLYIIGNNGQWQIYHSNIDQMEFYATPSVPLSNLNFSSSSNYLILADTSGSIHTMQRPHTNGGLTSSPIQPNTSASSNIGTVSTKLDQQQISGSGISGGVGSGGMSSSSAYNHQNHQHSFSVFHSYPLPNLNIPGANIGGGYSKQVNTSLYNYSYVKSIQTLMGIASNPVTKPVTHNVGHPTVPNLTVALRYLQGRPVVAYDSLNSIGIPPILEKLHNGKLNIREDSLLSFGNKFEIDQIRKIQIEFGWNTYKSSDELPHGLSIIKARTISRQADSSLVLNADAHSFPGPQNSAIRSPPNVGNMQSLAHVMGGTNKQSVIQSNTREHNEGLEIKHGHAGGSLAFSVDYIREVRPEMDYYKLKGLEFRMVDFLKAAINPDTNKYRNNNLVYGFPLLCLRGSMPIWYFRKKKNMSLYAIGGTQGFSGDNSHAKSLSLVPVKFHYKPRLNPNRREKLKNRRIMGGGISGENSIVGASGQGVAHTGGTLGHTSTNSSLPNGGDAQTVSRAEEDYSSLEEGLVSIEFDNDTLDFTQPFFMLFSFIPRLSYDILLFHVPGCTSEFCLACELVHLTFMLYSCKFNLKNGKGRNPDLFPCVILNSIYTLNMLRTIRHIPEIKQLGIDSEDSQQNQVGIPVVGGTVSSGGTLGVSGFGGLKFGGVGAGVGSGSPTNGLDDINLNGMTLVSHLPQVAFNQIRKTEIFWKFFLENLKRDMTNTKGFNPNTERTSDVQGTNAPDQIADGNEDSALERLIDSLFNIEVTTISSCVQAKHAFKSTQIVTYLDIPANHLLAQNSILIAQNLDASSKVGQKDDPILSQKLRSERFLKALNSNLLRIIAGRSFCKECGTSTACQHVRCITKLPQIIVLSCNIQSLKHWNEYGGMSPEEHEEFIKKNQVVGGGGSGANHEHLLNTEYSIPFDIRFSKLRKGFSSQNGGNTGETSGGIDIIQVDKSAVFTEGSIGLGGEQDKEPRSKREGLDMGNYQEYELVALVFGVYQGCSIQLPSGTHFCMYVKHKLLFNEMNNTQDKWYMINGSSILPVNNKNEIINFTSCWKLPTFLFYSDKNGSLSNYLFSKHPCLDFQLDLAQSDMELLIGRVSGCDTDIDENIDQEREKDYVGKDKEIPNHSLNNDSETENNIKSKFPTQTFSEMEILDIHGIKFKIPWKYPKIIHDHVIQQLESIIKLIKNEKNLSENPDSSQINDQLPFTTRELSNLCLNYFVRYPFSKGLLKKPKEINERLINTLSHSEFIQNSPMVVALDSEYVALDVEQSVVRSDGTKEILKKSQLSLARVSIVRCGKISLSGANDNIEINNKKGLIMDHYVSYGSNSQQPRDYLTKYSGVRPGDLDPKTSSHFLTSKSCILKKLQFLVDAGVVFIGHALPSDFKIINIYVPPFQIIDTVEIYRLPDERYISLKFLAKFVLNKNIQTEVHDSIVDAKTALELFLKHLSLKKSGSWNDFLSFLYSKGHSIDWKIEAIDISNFEHN